MPVFAHKMFEIMKRNEHIINENAEPRRKPILTMFGDFDLSSSGPLHWHEHA